MAKIKSAWYRPPSLAALCYLSDDAIREQERRYVGWLMRRWNCSEEDAELLIQVQCDEMAVAETVEVRSPSKVKEERWLSDRVCVRTVKVHHTRWHWENTPPWRWRVLPLWPGDEPRWPGDKPRWHWRKMPKPDAPPVHEVMVDGRRRDGFLSLSRARAYAERIIAQECSSSPHSIAVTPTAISA